ncbi:hypothetical protein ANN_13839 [Periplaneta americana]|uniref:Uncharacterized protein n=1 Tax=Periplaneta americana TaxID=6978 RepID=A0ABQ8SVY2_PERAM|nr:hypothetical protein ANN_13839 [Periplaneta americana]
MVGLWRAAMNLRVSKKPFASGPGGIRDSDADRWAILPQPLIEPGPVRIRVTSLAPGIRSSKPFLYKHRKPVLLPRIHSSLFLLLQMKDEARGRMRCRCSVLFSRFTAENSPIVETTGLELLSAASVLVRSLQREISKTEPPQDILTKGKEQ